MPPRPVFLALLAVLGCQAGTSRSANADLDTYLTRYSQDYQRLYHESALADWESNTHIVEGDSTNSVRTRRANEALARFVGSNDNIARIQGYLPDRDRLSPVQARQLDAMLYLAAEKPASSAAVVAERITAEAAQTEKLCGFEFRLHRKPITTNAIDDSLRISRRLPARLAAWEASVEVGPAVKPGMLRLRELRNTVVSSLGYPDYFNYQVSDYGMSADEMLALNDGLIRELRPLYREPHTWARYELAKRYGVPVPDQLPAHLASQSVGPVLDRAGRGEGAGRRCIRRRRTHTTRRTPMPRPGI